jgi:hypothetical protein
MQDVLLLALPHLLDGLQDILARLNHLRPQRLQRCQQPLSQNRQTLMHFAQGRFHLLR